MKILIVEDDAYKSEAISAFIKAEYSQAEIIIKDSLSSGIFEVMGDPKRDLIILDMSMPSFDATNKDPRGGLPESFAGEDFLSHMDLMGIKVPVVVVTQFETFERNETITPLSKLTTHLDHNYKDIFLGCVYFKSTSNDWRISLNRIIRKILK